MNRRTWLEKTGLATSLGIAFKPSQLFAQNPDLAKDNPIIKINANENPYGPSPMARQSMQEAIAKGNRYPIPQINALKQALGRKEGLSDQHILLGAGSTEILGLVGLWRGKDGGDVVCAEYTFPYLPTYADRIGAAIKRVPLKADRTHDLTAMRHAISEKTALVYICNPNNPTGTILKSDELEAFCRDVGKNTYILLDEAYLDYVATSDNRSMVSLVMEYPKIIIARTFSKIYGLAGMRIGYAVAHPDTIRILSQLHTGGNFGFSAVSLAAASASLQDTSFVALSKAKNAEAMRICTQTLTKLKIPYTPSHANFVYFPLNAPSAELQHTLASQNIQIGLYYEGEERFARISMGTVEEMQLFCTALENVWRT